MDVIYKYNDDEIRKLVKDKEIPDYFMDSVIFNNSDNEGDFLWDEDASGGESDDEVIPKASVDYQNISSMIDDI